MPDATEPSTDSPEDDARWYVSDAFEEDIAPFLSIVDDLNDLRRAGQLVHGRLELPALQDAPALFRVFWRESWRKTLEAELDARYFNYNERWSIRAKRRARIRRDFKRNPEAYDYDADYFRKRLSRFDQMVEFCHMHQNEIANLIDGAVRYSIAGQKRYDVVVTNLKRYIRQQLGDCPFGLSQYHTDFAGEVLYIFLKVFHDDSTKCHAAPAVNAEHDQTFQSPFAPQTPQGPEGRAAPQDELDRRIALYRHKQANIAHADADLRRRQRAARSLMQIMQHTLRLQTRRRFSFAYEDSEMTRFVVRVQRLIGAAVVTEDLLSVACDDAWDEDSGPEDIHIETTLLQDSDSDLAAPEFPDVMPVELNAIAHTLTDCLLDALAEQIACGWTLPVARDDLRP